MAIATLSHQKGGCWWSHKIPFGLGEQTGFDSGLELTSILDDAPQRPFVGVGFVSFILLIPLAVTSTQSAMKRLGSAWRKLHALSYLIAALALAHFWIQAKAGDSSPLPYSLALGALLAFRLMAWQAGERTSGVEVRER